MMQTFAIEARRTEDGPWMPVMTVQEDLVDEIAPMVGGPGEWRIRPEDPEPQHPLAPQRKTVKVTPWDRLKWWAMFRFSRRARR